MLLLDTPEMVDSRGLTASVHFGFMRDMPINRRRNLSIAIGLGASFDEYGYNTLYRRRCSKAELYSPLKRLMMLLMMSIDLAPQV